MNQRKIIEKTLEVYKKCNIKSFPIDCVRAIKALGIPLYKYSELPESKIKKCLLVSDDAFTLQGSVFYNDNFPYKERQHFSLMHEVGHIILEHTGERPENEEEADSFSSNFLAPRPVMWYLHCESVKDIYYTFGVSCTAANRIAKEYRTFCFWEHEKLHKSICDWFFPRTTTYSSDHSEPEAANKDIDSNFIDTLRFLRGEGYIFERTEYYHLHGRGL